MTSRGIKLVHGCCFHERGANAHGDIGCCFQEPWCRYDEVVVSMNHGVGMIII